MIAGAHASTNAALAVCNAPGSVIEVRRPAGGCSDPNVVINGLVNITIRSSELDGLGGPVSFESINNLPALQIRNSAAINVSGISGFAGQQVAVWIVDSEASFKHAGRGSRLAATPRSARRTWRCWSRARRASRSCTPGSTIPPPASG